MGLFTAEQLEAMALAVALENSGHRFLWVVRNPPTDDEANLHLSQAEPEFNALLPEGFLERTKERGLVVKSWAPQVEVLNHDSVVGFVTHWSLRLELYSGGYMCWRANVGLAVIRRTKDKSHIHSGQDKGGLGLNESENGFVIAAELEHRISELLDLKSKNGKAVREQVMATRNYAKAAPRDGGSSYLSL